LISTVSKDQFYDNEFCANFGKKILENQCYDNFSANFII
jgi:hypothetical protein